MKNGRIFWSFIYNIIVIPVLLLGMQAARFFNPKVREGIRGRRGLFGRLLQARAELEPGRQFIVIHCTSAGEFEAARPLLAALRQRLPQLKAHVTCYSPSGMRALLNATEVESFSYLPFDDFFSARRFFRILKPAAFIIVKHDVWPNMVWAAAQCGLPVLWINANLHIKSKRVKFFFRGLNRSFLEQIDEILTVGDDHAQRLARIASVAKIHVVGDSRYDRTLERFTQISQASANLLPARWKGSGKLILGGSTWGPDQRLLIPVFAALKKDHPDLRLVLVPHEPKAEFLADTIFYLTGYKLSYLLYSSLTNESDPTDVLIVDKVGILAGLYQEAWAAYVGGAFGEGVHSVLEPAAFNLPIFFGPKHYMSHEAGYLIQRGGAWSVRSALELEKKLRKLLEDKSAWNAAARISGTVVRSGAGATGRILNHLERLLQP